MVYEDRACIAVLGDVDFHGSFNLERVHSRWSKILAIWSSLGDMPALEALFGLRSFRIVSSSQIPRLFLIDWFPPFIRLDQLFLQLYPHSFITTTHPLSVSRLSQGAPLVLRHVGSSFLSTFTGATKATRLGPLGG